MKWLSKWEQDIMLSYRRRMKKIPGMKAEQLPLSDRHVFDK
jgi:hypothetical protein